MRRNGQNFTSGQILNPKFEIPMGCLYSNTNFDGASAKIYRLRVLSEKWFLKCKIFGFWGIVGKRVEMFYETPRRPILA